MFVENDYNDTSEENHYCQTQIDFIVDIDRCSIERIAKSSYLIYNGLEIQLLITGLFTRCLLYSDCLFTRCLFHAVDIDNLLIYVLVIFVTGIKERVYYSWFSSSIFRIRIRVSHPASIVDSVQRTE